MTLASIPDLIRLLNALPKPVTIPCLIDTLDRPLAITATSNPFSGQPANGARSPRIFLLVNNLTLSVVPAGESATLLEFGFKTDDTHSVKGELHFPITEQLADDAAFTPILSGKNGDVTVCRPCHFPTPAAEHGPHAYQSRIIRPDAYQEFPFSSLQHLNENCQTEEGEECAVIQSIFFGNAVKAARFP